jgi:hypothetical protein
MRLSYQNPPPLSISIFTYSEICFCLLKFDSDQTITANRFRNLLAVRLELAKIDRLNFLSRKPYGAIVFLRHLAEFSLNTAHFKTTLKRQTD